MIALFLIFTWLESATAYLGFNLYRFHTAPAEAFHRKMDESLNSLAATVQTKLPQQVSFTKPLILGVSSTNEKNLPWSASINPLRDLAYMPMFVHQLDAVHRRGMRQVSIEERMAYQASHVKPARIGNLCFECERFRKVRMTYFDAGEHVQVSK